MIQSHYNSQLLVPPQAPTHDFEALVSLFGRVFPWNHTIISKCVLQLTYKYVLAIITLAHSAPTNMSDNYCRNNLDNLHRIGALYERLSPTREPEFHNRFQGSLVQARRFAEYFQVLIGLNPNATPSVACLQAFAKLQQVLERIEQEYEAECERRRQQPDTSTHPEGPIRATSYTGQKLKEFPDSALAHRADTQREAIIQKSLGVDHLEDGHFYVLSPPRHSQK